MELPGGTGLGELVDNEDYYSLLNASREATQEELKLCYRRLCMVYHPDKHDSSKSKDASNIFGRVQTAYSVLSDPMKRHIYDVYGKKGLEADWQIVERQKTPQEMREEYERIQKMRAQFRLEERTHPKGSFSMTVNATSVFDQPYDVDDYYDDRMVFPDITKMALSQSIEVPLTVSQTATISGNLTSNNGNGSGSCDLAWRKTLSNSAWGEIDMQATDSKVFNFGIKGYRSLGGGLFALVHFPVSMAVDNDLVAINLPGLNATMGRVMGKEVFGSLNLRLGQGAHISTNLVRETSRFRISGKLQLGIPHSFGVCSLTYKLAEEEGNFKLAVKAGTFGCMVEYGAEHRVSKHSVVAAHVNIGVPLGVNVKLRLNRASQTYSMPIMLSDDVNFMAAFYGTMVPITLYAAIHILIIRPYKRKAKEKEAEENEQSLINETNKKREEAIALVNMMRESTERKLTNEERKMGLVITEAWYGRFVSDTSSKSSKLVDVSIPLQNLVENSTLQLPADITKSGLPGFYDPCPGHEKKLKVVYKFRGRQHQALIDDKEALRIPLKSHSLQTDQ
ncbi:dnaJ homolog subfamily C member 11-like [Clavelina lepadiformis]|uniref:dnaJ homolog subfamily C member 11-like n=1 Tax=Clavelina lepadiformis TaxID=159417 RepID=UPI00404364CA